MALLTSVLGMIPIIIEVGIDPLKNKIVHSLLGVSTLALAFLQPIIAAMRCAPNHRMRPIFNWTHGSIGLFVLALGWVSVFFTTELPQPEVPTYFAYPLYGFLAWVLISHSGVNVYKMVKAGEAKTSLEDDKTLKILGSVFALVLSGTVIALCIMVIIGP